MVIMEGIYHTIRFETAYKWQDWHNAGNAAQNNPGSFGPVECASIGNNLHVVACSAGNLYHTVRYANSWQVWRNVSATTANNPGSFGQVACASIGNALHVIGLGPDGKLYHTIRTQGSTKTKWQAWDNASARIANNPGVPNFPQCASVGNDLHVLAIIAGDLYHTIRYSNGNWKDWDNASALIPGYPGPFAFEACAGIGNDLHVIACSAGNLYHTVRYGNPYVNPPWQDWRNVSAQVAQNPGYINRADSAALGNDLHVVASANELAHTIRPGNSYSWQPTPWQPWGNVSRAAANDPQDPLPDNVIWLDLSCAGIGIDLHVIGFAVRGPS